MSHILSCLRLVKTAGSGPPSAKDFGRKRTTPARPEKRRKPGAGDDGRNVNRQSLRIGTGKKGRAAEITQRRGSLKKRDRTSEKYARLEAALERKTVMLPDGPLSVIDLAEILEEKPVSVIKFLMTDLGVMASMTQNLDSATCVAVAEGFGKIVGGAEDMEDDLMEGLEESALATGVVFDEDDPADLKPRAPVVTIMGHVDHGKTSLLDTIRKTQVTAGEAGGITQHIAAYQVTRNDQTITFVDTPGHAAFTDMRERGANITDIIVLVVAADDGVKQQTADSIACARQAGVPLIVAINKCDLETADPTKVMTELTSYDVLTEEFGGDVLSSQISAKKGTNIDDLLDKIMLQAEIQDIKANPDRDAECIVVEANVEKGLGTVATTLVQKGTLRVGDVFVAGETHGKVRALLSTSNNDRMKEVGPSTPVRVVGFEGVPCAGDVLIVAKDEQTAREMAENRQRIAREKSSSSYQAGLMDSVAMTFGAVKESREMCVVVKADVQGSAEALTRALRDLKREDDQAIVTVKVLVSEAGEVSKSDIAIASVTPDTTVIAFNIPASFAAMEDSRVAGVPIEYYNIIYDAIESVESRMQEVLSPTPEGEYVGSAKVQEVFNIGGTGNIAGSRCTNGFLKKGANVRVMRGDKILIESRIKTLRNFKAETDSIEEGNECGIGLLDFEAFEPGDVIECYVE
jgi:translation initiation factor IF-2